MHIRAALVSVVRPAKAIGRLMPIVAGPSVGKRRLLVSVVANKLLYVAQVSALVFRVNCKVLDRAERFAALRITHCYLMVSMKAAFFLAEIPPEDMLAKERELR